MKTILLTGAEGGIGKATKETLDQAGLTVIGIDRNEANLASYADIEQLEKKVGEKIDWIICAHGFISTETDLEKQTPEDIQKTFEVNSLSLVYLAKAFLKHLNPGGGMIFLSSAAGINANGRYAAYSASKAAANVFAQALARNKPEFTFISLCPGPTNTPMREMIAHDASKHQSPAVIADVIKKIIEGHTEYKSGDVILVHDSQTSIAARLVN